MAQLGTKSSSVRVEQYFFRRISISRFSYVQNQLHLICRIFQLISLNNIIIEIPIVYCLHFTMNIAHHIPEMLTFYADKVLAMGRSGNSRVFNFAILLKSRKLDAHKKFMFYSIKKHE